MASPHSPRSPGHGAPIPTALESSAAGESSGLDDWESPYHVNLTERHADPSGHTMDELTSVDDFASGAEGLGGHHNASATGTARQQPFEQHRELLRQADTERGGAASLFRRSRNSQANEGGSSDTAMSPEGGGSDQSALSESWLANDSQRSLAEEAAAVAVRRRNTHASRYDASDSATTKSRSRWQPERGETSSATRTATVSGHAAANGNDRQVSPAAAVAAAVAVAPMSDPRMPLRPGGVTDVILSALAACQADDQPTSVQSAMNNKQQQQQQLHPAAATENASQPSGQNPHSVPSARAAWNTGASMPVASAVLPAVQTSESGHGGGGTTWFDDTECGSESALSATWSGQGEGIAYHFLTSQRSQERWAQLNLIGGSGGGGDGDGRGTHTDKPANASMVEVVQHFEQADAAKTTRQQRVPRHYAKTSSTPCVGKKNRRPPSSLNLTAISQVSTTDRFMESTDSLAPDALGFVDIPHPAHNRNAITKHYQPSHVETRAAQTSTAQPRTTADHVQAHHGADGDVAGGADVPQRAMTIYNNLMNEQRRGGSSVRSPVPICAVASAGRRIDTVPAAATVATGHVAASLAVRQHGEQEAGSETDNTAPNADSDMPSSTFPDDHKSSAQPATIVVTATTPAKERSAPESMVDMVTPARYGRTSNFLLSALRRKRSPSSMARSRRSSTHGIVVKSNPESIPFELSKGWKEVGKQRYGLEDENDIIQQLADDDRRTFYIKPDAQEEWRRDAVEWRFARLHLVWLVCACLLLTYGIACLWHTLQVPRSVRSAVLWLVDGSGASAVVANLTCTRPSDSPVLSSLTIGRHDATLSAMMMLECLFLLMSGMWLLRRFRRYSAQLLDSRKLFVLIACVVMVLAGFITCAIAVHHFSVVDNLIEGNKAQCHTLEDGGCQCGGVYLLCVGSPDNSGGEPQQHRNVSSQGESLLTARIVDPLMQCYEQQERLMDFLQFKLPLAGFGVILQAGAVLFTMAALVFSIREHWCLSSQRRLTFDDNWEHETEEGRHLPIEKLCERRQSRISAGKTRAKFIARTLEKIETTTAAVTATGAATDGGRHNGSSTLVNTIVNVAIFRGEDSDEDHVPPSQTDSMANLYGVQASCARSRIFGMGMSLTALAAAVKKEDLSASSATGDGERREDAGSEVQESLADESDPAGLRIPASTANRASTESTAVVTHSEAVGPVSTSHDLGPQSSTSSRARTAGYCDDKRVTDSLEEAGRTGEDGTANTSAHCNRNSLNTHASRSTCGDSAADDSGDAEKDESHSNSDSTLQQNNSGNPASVVKTPPASPTQSDTLHASAQHGSGSSPVARPAASRQVGNHGDGRVLGDMACARTVADDCHDNQQTITGIDGIFSSALTQHTADKHEQAHRQGEVVARSLPYRKWPARRYIPGSSEDLLPECATSSDAGAAATTNAVYVLPATCHSVAATSAAAAYADGELLAGNPMLGPAAAAVGLHHSMRRQGSLPRRRSGEQHLQRRGSSRSAVVAAAGGRVSLHALMPPPPLSASSAAYGRGFPSDGRRASDSGLSLATTADADAERSLLSQSYGTTDLFGSDMTITQENVNTLSCSATSAARQHASQSDESPQSRSSPLTVPPESSDTPDTASALSSSGDYDHTHGNDTVTNGNDTVTNGNSNLNVELHEDNPRPASTTPPSSNNSSGSSSSPHEQGEMSSVDFCESIPPPRQDTDHLVYSRSIGGSSTLHQSPASATSSHGRSIGTSNRLAMATAPVVAGVGDGGNGGGVALVLGSRLREPSQTSSSSGAVIFSNYTAETRV